MSNGQDFVMLLLSFTNKSKMGDLLQAYLYLGNNSLKARIINLMYFF